MKPVQSEAFLFLGIYRLRGDCYFEVYMKIIRKDAKFAAVLLGAFFLLAQTIRIEKSNPPMRSDIAAEPSVKPLLRRACYNCHSNETVWPWYSNVAPASWLVGSDVKEARQRMNFSEWGAYSSERQHSKLIAITDEMKDAGMPPWYYSLVHSESHLTEAERNEIKAWTARALDPLSPKP
jgi:hypothetical protein